MNHTPRQVLQSNGRLLAAGMALVLSLAALPSHLAAQGCVPIKEMGDSTVDLGDATSGAAGDKWDVTEAFEHFRSYLDFIGSDNNTAARNAAANQVINVVNQFDTSLSYTPDVMDTFTLDIPYFSASRSQLAVGYGRIKTYGSGIGDTRVTADRWLIDPRTNPRGDVSIGFGLSIPTGTSNEKDNFPSATTTTYHNVDQSIQPGEGGWGFIGEFNAYYRVIPGTTLYANGFYMVTPQDTNGTRTTSAITSETAFDSVYDQYEIRGGVTQRLWKTSNGVLDGSLGGRWEGVPADDLIGGSDGFRRPGYVLSVEPGLAYNMPHDSFSFSVPIAEYMNRTQSYPDTLTGGHGDAFFAKFLVLASYSHRW